MSGMTGYDQTTSYPSQYNYVPNLQSPDPSLVAGGVDPRHLQSWGMATANQSHAHYTHMQGSPGQHGHPAAAGHRGYSSYYDRNGYYVHQHGAAAAAAATGNGGGAFDSWHDPGGMRPESPTSGAGIAPPTYPSPAATSAASSSVNYSCKMAVQPPAHSAGATPPSPTQQKTNDNPQLQSPYGGGQPPYGQCQLSQNSQQAGGPGVGGAAGGGAVTPNSFSSQLPPQAGGGPPGVHNNYPMNEGSATPGGPGPAGGSSAGAPMGQPSPVQQGGGQNSSGAPQASLPSPLYPWMRSQFGKT